MTKQNSSPEKSEDFEDPELETEEEEDLEEESDDDSGEEDLEEDESLEEGEEFEEEASEDNNEETPEEGESDDEENDEKEALNEEENNEEETLDDEEIFEEDNEDETEVEENNEEESEEIAESNAAQIETDNVALPQLVNFLTPIILLYALFMAISVLSEGFFPTIYAALILLAGLLLFSSKTSYKKLLAHINFRLLYVIFLLCFLACTISVLLLISDFLMI